MALVDSITNEAMDRSFQHIGIGFRRDLVEDILSSDTLTPSFVELAPENWMGMGGHWKKILQQLAEKYPITSHGLSLSIGSMEPLDYEFLAGIKQFISDYQISIYSEHLSFSKCDNAHLYDLLPIPFQEEAIVAIVEKIKRVQDFLNRPLVLENVSYYTSIASEMDEATFISEILKRSDCRLLLDINNVYVNAFNHKYSAKEFIQKLPLDRVSYIHMAGHEQVSEDLIIDTHGENIVPGVFELFEWAVSFLNPVKVLLERDFNFPSIPQLQSEMQQLEDICQRKWIEKSGYTFPKK